MARKTIKGKDKAEQADLGLENTCTALYIRVSTTKQADEGYSLDAQARELGAYCQANGWQVCDGHIYIDAGLSGKSTDRPQFQAMLEAAKDGKIQRIVATKLDRIARNLKDLLQTVDELKQYGCALVIKKEAFDTGTPQGVFVMQMLGAVSELERSMISERVQSGRLEKAKAGGFNGAPPPYGYSYQNEQFVIVPSQGHWVREIFASFLAGRSINSIAKDLNDKGAPTQKGGQWYAMTVQQILRNGAYAGLAQWDGLENDGAYPAIISKETYEATHRRLQALRPGKQVAAEIERRLQEPEKWL